MTDDSVRVGAVADDSRGGWIPDLDTRIERVSPTVRELCSGSDRLANADRITIVPDTHYPFHPSTGLVTDPAVVGALVDCFETQTDAAVAVAGASNEYVAFDRTTEYLGYPELLERFDAELVDLTDQPRTSEILELDGRQVTFPTPRRLLESAVVVVPTLRPTEDGLFAGGMRTLADVSDRTLDADVAAAAATRTVDPAVSVLDATTAYGNSPTAGNALFAGTVPAVDVVGTSLLGGEVATDGALELATDDEDTPVTVERVGANASELAFDELEDRLSNAELPPSNETSPAVTAAYRLYAAVGGDAVPPQLEGGR
ncbi:DUF362 domain-containing protein [Natrialbaceae archaeon A-arb3/5]